MSNIEIKIGNFGLSREDLCPGTLRGWVMKEIALSDSSWFDSKEKYLQLLEAVAKSIISECFMSGGEKGVEEMAKEKSELLCEVESIVFRSKGVRVVLASNETPTLFSLGKYLSGPVKITFEKIQGEIFTEDKVSKKLPVK